MKAFRVQSSAWGKGTLMPATTFDACKLLISNKNETGRKSKKMKKEEESNRNKISN